jgi:DNA-binding MarR family transcriptional regulator
LVFEAGTGYLLARAGSLSRRRWARMLTEHGVTPHHYGVLMALRELGPVGQRRLGEAIDVDPRNLVAVLDGLAERGLVHRDVDPADRRRRVVGVTDAGGQLVGELIDAGATIEAEFFAGLSATERSELHRMLVTLVSPTAEPE